MENDTVIFSIDSRKPVVDFDDAYFLEASNVAASLNELGCWYHRFNRPFKVYIENNVVVICFLGRPIHNSKDIHPSKMDPPLTLDRYLKNEVIHLSDSILNNLFD